MEMKKSYSPFGSTPLSVDEVLPDIQTGRAVYPDKDKEADASYMERINQYKHEGFHDVSEGSGGSGGSVDCGYSCTEEWVTLTDESVTTETSSDGNMSVLSYSEQIVADTIRVTFDGVEYSCPLLNDGSYGAPFDLEELAFDWSEYPFNLLRDNGNNTLTTQTAGTYQIKIEVFEATVETSECFKKAVRDACHIKLVMGGDGYGTVTLAPMSAKDAWDALENGSEILIYYHANQNGDDFHVMRLFVKLASPMSMYNGVVGTYYRFSTFAFKDSNDVIYSGYTLDIFHPENTDEYYWVYNNYYAGKHE